MPPTPQPPDAAPGLADPLGDACRALWLATLSLMTAFLHITAPAHRLLLARRIARNLLTLARQPECFGAPTCARFAWLADRWQRRAQALAPGPAADSPGVDWLSWLRSLRRTRPASSATP